MITRESFNERQGRLLNLLTALFEQQPFLDTTTAAAVYLSFAKTGSAQTAVCEMPFSCPFDSPKGSKLRQPAAL